MIVVSHWPKPAWQNISALLCSVASDTLHSMRQGGKGRTGSVAKEAPCLLTIYHASKKSMCKKDTPPIGGWCILTHHRGSHSASPSPHLGSDSLLQIGRASCRERRWLPRERQCH